MLIWIAENNALKYHLLSTYSEIDAVLSILHGESPNVHNNSAKGYYHSHFTNEETEVIFLKRKTW